MVSVKASYAESIFFWMVPRIFIFSVVGICEYGLDDIFFGASAHWMSAKFSDILASICFKCNRKPAYHFRQSLFFSSCPFRNRKQAANRNENEKNRLQELDCNELAAIPFSQSEIAGYRIHAETLPTNRCAGYGSRGDMSDMTAIPAVKANKSQVTVSQQDIAKEFPKGNKEIPWNFIPTWEA